MNGKLVPWNDARVHVLTHTLHYGVGAFEGIRCYECNDGRSAVFRLREHIVREIGKTFKGHIVWGEDLLVVPVKGPAMYKME